MPLTAIQCKNCGSALQVDSTAKSYYCPFCQTAYAMEQTINQTFQTTNIGHIETATIIDDGSGKIDQEINNGEAHLQLKKYGKARSIFEDLTNRCAQKYRVWWGLARAVTEDFTKDPYGKKEYEFVVDALNSAVLLAPVDARVEISEAKTAYHTKWQGYYKQLVAERKQKTDDITRRTSESIPPKLLEINSLQADIAKKTAKMNRLAKTKALLPTICFIIVGALLLPSVIEWCGFLIGILVSALVSGLFMLLPLKVILFLITNAIGIPTNAAIRRSQERISQLQDAIQVQEHQFEQERIAVARATRWLDV